MSLEIEIINEQEEYNFTAEHVQLLERVLNAAAEAELLADSELAITLVDETTIRNLNRDYRGIDQSTDVLSFALNEGIEGELEFDHEEYLLGDIIISMPHVYRQAAEYGHSVERELAFLALHGFLHLIGETHDTDEEAQQMFAKQEQILTNLNILR